jgi:small ligand-binding sensory domain FIST
MTRFVQGVSQHPSAREAVAEVAGQILEGLGGDEPDLLAVFVSPQHLGAFGDVARTLDALCRPAVLVGCTAHGVIGGAHEIEDGPAIAALAGRLPGTTVTPVALEFLDTPDGPTVLGWPDDGDRPAQATALVLLADPFSFPTDAFLARLDEAAPGLAVIGGLASAARGPGGNRLAVGGRAADELRERTSGAVGVLLDGGVSVHTVVSQGCRPIGRPYVVTRGERHWIQELGGRPALERLRDVVAEASDEERELFQRGAHVGRVVDERKLDYTRGDFLVRNLMGADQRTGAVAVGDVVEVGQTVQFHVRDADSADEDLRELLTGTRAEAALLFTCNGRGSHLFGEPDHDAGLVDRMLGPLPIAGFFCAGEMGPVGGRNFLHGFTASLALFQGPSDEPPAPEG